VRQGVFVNIFINIFRIFQETEKIRNYINANIENYQYIVYSLNIVIIGGVFVRTKLYKKITAKLLLLLFSTAFIFNLTGIRAFAADVEKALPATGYTKLITDTNISTEKTDADGQNYGYVKPLISFSATQVSQSAKRSLALPSSFDLRTYNRVTPVQDQNPAGTCWAFAAMSSAESSYVTESGVDHTKNYFSENHMKNQTGSVAPYGWDWDTNNGGGNITKATAYFARGIGPASITADPYNPYGVWTSDSDNIPAINHVMNVMWLPSKTSYTDNNTIKNAIMTYGAVDVAFYWNNAYYKSATSSYYYKVTDLSELEFSNHEVAIVGWDDNYAASNFNITPPGNGAYIVKNNWGTSWGSSGYFYVSYYDMMFGFDELAVFTQIESPNNYAHLYSYTPFGNVNYAGASSTTLYGAAIYTVSGAETLTSVSTYFGAPGSSYEISVYKNVSDSNPKNGTLVSSASTSGSVTYAGYYNIELSSPVELPAGQSFSIIIKYTTPGWYWPVPLQDYTSVTKKVTAQAGQTFISISGSSFDDITSIITDHVDFSDATVNISAITIIPLKSISAITGTTAVGSVLTAGTISPPEAIASYQWLRADSSSGTYSPIAGATASTYTLTADDFGKYIKITATGGGKTVTSKYAGPVKTAVTGIGAISGTPQVFYTLTAGDVSPAGATVKYQWLRYDSGTSSYIAISGATKSTYATTASDVDKTLIVQVTGSGIYTGTASSTVIGPISRAELVSIGDISGKTTAKQKLTAGDLTPEKATATYQWYSSSSSDSGYTEIAGATSNTYTTTYDDVGKYINVTAVGSGSYSGTVTSIPVGVITTTIGKIGKISGTLAVNSTLTAGAMTPEDATLSYQWLRADSSSGTYTEITGATGSTYTLTADDLGKYIKVSATGTGNYSGTSTSSSAGPVKTAITGVGAISGTAQVFYTLTAGAVSPAGAEVKYQWMRYDAGTSSYVKISGATKSTYTTNASDVDKTLIVQLTGYGIYTGTVSSAAFGPIERAQLLSIGGISGKTTVKQKLTAGVTAPAKATVTYQWLRSGSYDSGYTEISGATAKTYTTTYDDVGKYIKVVAVGSGSYYGTVMSEPVGVISATLSKIGKISGTPYVNSTLTAGELTPPDATVTYQWLRADSSKDTFSPIPGATGSTYTLTADDLGKYIKVSATGTGSCSGTVTSSYIGPVKSAITGGAEISGSAVVGGTLTSGAIVPSGATVKYQWMRCSTADGTFRTISGATGSTYVLKSTELGQFIMLKITATGSYAGTLLSNVLGPVVNAP
jgi:C1A family cysteine protease